MSFHFYITTEHLLYIKICLFIHTWFLCCDHLIQTTKLIRKKKKPICDFQLSLGEILIIIDDLFIRFYPVGFTLFLCCNTYGCFHPCLSLEFLEYKKEQVQTNIYKNILKLNNKYYLEQDKIIFKIARLTLSNDTKSLGAITSIRSS